MADAPADKPKKKKGRLLGLLIPVLAFVAGAGAGGAGAGIALVKFGVAGAASGHAKPPPAEAVPEGPLEYVPIENAFTSNLADSGRYLQVKISLSTFGGSDAVAAIGKHQPAIVSAVLAALGEVREPDIADARAKDVLREKLKGVINAALKAKGEPGGVDEVFFTSLVVQ